MNLFRQNIITQNIIENKECEKHKVKDNLLKQISKNILLIQDYVISGFSIYDSVK